MREYLFHGKRLDNGEWVEGSFILVGNYYILGMDWPYLNSQVIPETIGQFTGRLDAYDKRIFEGHIVRFYRTNSLGRTTVRVGKVAFDTYNGTPAFCVIDPTGCRWSFDSLGEVEVIGNIHDNHELLEVTPDE